MLNLKEKRYAFLDFESKHGPLTDEKFTELENLQHDLGIFPCLKCEGVGEVYMMTTSSGWNYEKCPRCHGLGEEGFSEKLRNKMLLNDYKYEQKEEYDEYGIEMALGEELYKSQKTPKHNIVIIKELSEGFNYDKRIVQRILQSFIEEERKMKWCEATNHGNGKYIVSDDYGGPESGYMGYHCKKCGFSNGNQLY
jgi:hypothetical protein